MISEQQIDIYANCLWQEMAMYSPLKPASCIIVLGSVDIRSADCGAALMRSGLAPYIVFSGNCGRNTQGVFTATEAQLFAEQARLKGVPQAQILLEPKATNTGENVKFSMELLAQQQIEVEKVILVHKDFATKRAYATFKQHFPSISVMVTGPRLSYADYPNDIIDKDLLINTLVGDMQRMKRYPELGYQIPMPVSAQAEAAYEALVAAGYTAQLIK
ncbi:YdcF family protein [Motilimonas eburnea]|uniref:YdcF family protein n=1 Tax=Motilimonas eburnea TaxID=1737488 RepID=UPI001E2CFB3B|nr:YdcF family protein [Motilimonas eburnea]MCE2571341.1 YdcF family protein [Motilimonas eburnea]